ncbi:acetolactate synthase large subunit [Halodurantibacterium flavum]|uniref:Acetolactate synthase large subunit n=1 Tax=Halodurantibacterium flavum TaxID=1382802 RepID=A0ABW4RZT4_9RHOB
MPDTQGAGQMNGAESLVRTLVASGVDTCFANPGTSEMHFVAALDRVPGVRCILGLFEGVVSGAADGYGRMTDRPAATLLHLGPGLGNALANLHNAKKARTPMVNVVGDHATHHAGYDAPLSSDVEGVARPMSHWVRTSPDAQRIAADGAQAVAESLTGAGRIATLILPADTAWNPSNGPAAPVAIPPKPRVPEEAVEIAANILRQNDDTVIILAGKGLRARTIGLTSRIAARTGAAMLAPTSNARVERGAGRTPIKRIFYAVDAALEQLSPYRNAILVGVDEPPVAFFAYPGKPSLTLPPTCTVHRLAGVDDDLADALERLAVMVDAADTEPVVQDRVITGLPHEGGITPETIAQTVAALLPENAIIVDEGISCSRALYAATAGAPAHDWLALTGGSIGIGMPLAAGAAVACPDRKVVNFQADGSGLYTAQALWTQAREQLDILTVVFANNAYASLDVELANVGAINPGRTARDMLELDRPVIDWVSLAKGYGVPGARAQTLDQLITLMREGLARKGPMLIEVPCEA